MLAMAVKALFFCASIAVLLTKSWASIKPMQVQAAASRCFLVGFGIFRILGLGV